MKQNVGYKTIPLSFSRRAMIASGTVSKEYNTLHSMMEVDITIPRRIMREHLEKTGEHLSFTAYIVTCLAHVIKDHPRLNSFHKGGRQIILDDAVVTVMVERDVKGEKEVDPICIDKAQTKSYRVIHDEIREAQKLQENKSVSSMPWLKVFPDFLLRAFFRIALHNKAMAIRYGKLCVSSVGMFCKDAVWFIPLGGATVLVTVGAISQKIVQSEGAFIAREYLCLTVSFDHDVVDGAPAARFLQQFTGCLKSGELLKSEIDQD